MLHGNKPLMIYRPVRPLLGRTNNIISNMTRDGVWALYGRYMARPHAMLRSFCRN